MELILQVRTVKQNICFRNIVSCRLGLIYVFMSGWTANSKKATKQKHNFLNESL